MHFTTEESIEAIRAKFAELFGKKASDVLDFCENDFPKAKRLMEAAYALGREESLKEYLFANPPTRTRNNY